MDITFLGSAAAEGIPFPYCDCETCAHARKHKGKNIRKRCAYMINNDFLIDVGPDLFTACAEHDVDLLNVRYMAVTHSHLDHLLVQNLKLRSDHFHNGTKLPKLTFVGGPSTMTMLNQSGSKDSDMGIERVPILPYETSDLGSYHLKSIRATHFPALGDAMNFIIDDGESKIMIASDTGLYQDDVWEHLRNLQLDTLIIEMTKGIFDSNHVHLNIEDAESTIKSMKEIDAITEKTAIYATHFGHQHCPPHDELHSILHEKGIECVYDGLRVTV